MLIGRALLTYTSHLVEEWIHSCSKYYQIKKQGSIVLGSIIIHINSCSTLCLWLTDHLYNKVYFWWDSKKFYHPIALTSGVGSKTELDILKSVIDFFHFFVIRCDMQLQAVQLTTELWKSRFFFFYRLCRSTLINDLTDGFNPITR